MAKVCERCGKKYRLRTISENKGKHLCRDCVAHCSVCGKKLPRSNYFGETASIVGAFLGPIGGSLRDNRRPHVGSGMCNECFYKEQERLKKNGEKIKDDDPYKVLKIRYVKGEISEGEYEKMKKILDE